MIDLELVTRTALVVIWDSFFYLIICAKGPQKTEEYEIS